MQNARSYFGRLSGLALFLLGLLVVGLLVIFTVTSANDDSGTVTVEDGTASSESAGSDEPVAIPDLDSEPSVADDRAAVSEGGSQEEPGTVASDEDGLPNTGPEDAIMPAAVIGLLVWQISNWRDSRRQLASPGNLAKR